MATKRPNKAEKEWLEKIKELGCVACFVQSGVWGTPGQIHHFRDGVGMAQRSGWDSTICLCINHHEISGNGKFAFHAGRKQFISNYGTEKELLSITLENL